MIDRIPKVNDSLPSTRIDREWDPTHNQDGATGVVPGILSSHRGASMSSSDSPLKIYSPRSTSSSVARDATKRCGSV
jgi:hypothetical protein